MLGKRSDVDQIFSESAKVNGTVTAGQDPSIGVLMCDKIKS